MSNLLIHEPPLQVLPTLAVCIGLNEAIILQQLHYWLTRTKSKHFDGRNWIYNTHQEWQKQFPFWSEKTIRRALSNLESLGLLLTGNYNAHKFDKTKWYAINYTALDDLELSTTRYGQNDHIDTPNRPHDHLDKMTTSYKDTNKLPKNSNRDARVPDEMLKIWNTVITPNGGDPIRLTPERKKELFMVFENVFLNDLARWEKYCRRIASSSFLMGKTDRSDWRATLDWAMRPENIVRVEEGAYGGEEPVREEKDEASLEEKKIVLIDSVEGSSHFKAFQHALLQKIGVQNFESWFKNVREERFDGDIFVVKAPNAFVADYIKERYMTEIQDAAHHALGANVHVEIVW